MKKILFPIAFGALIISSCSKETEIEQEVSQDPITNGAYVRAIGEDYSAQDINGTTKATLNNGGEFLWAEGDQIGVRLYKGTAITGTDGGSGFGAYDATFTLNAEDAGKTSGELTCSTTPMDEYLKAHAAWYPRYGEEANKTNVGGDTKLYFYLREWYDSYSSGTSLMPMMADMSSWGQANPNIALKHVGAGIRVTLKGVPAIANQVSLTVNGKNIWGWYTIDDPSQAGSASISAGDGTNSTIYLKFATASDPRDITFIFPLPTVDLSGGITLKLYYGDPHTELWSKTAGTKTPLPALDRGDLLDLPDLPVAEWKTLGTGRFIDNFLWSKITSDGYNVTVGKDVPGYVNVTIQQNVSDPKTFRLVNPYGAAATQFGYTSANAANRDEYFVFTVAGFAQGDRVTNFETHRTGFAIDSGHSNPELVYAKTYNSEWDPSNDMVVLGGETAPKIVQLAPVYRYNGSSTAYAYSSHLNNRKGVFRIIFPGVDGYTCSLTPASGCTARLDKVSWANGSSSVRMRIVASQYTDYEVASPIVNDYYIGNYPGAKDAAGSSGTWSGASLTNTTVNGSSIPSGVVYLTWYAVDSSSENYVYDQGRTKVYYINKTDYDQYVKSHTFHYGETSAAGAWKYGTIEFGLSDDPTKGQLILKDVDGMTSVAANTRLTADHPLWTAMGTWLAHGTGDYAYAADRVSDGNTYYGVINNNRISFATNSDFEFFNYSVDGVSGHTAKVIIFSNDGSSSDLPTELAFDITSDKLTLAHDYLVARWIGYYWNGSTVTNSGGRASKPLAQKDGDQRPYISLE